MSIKLKISFTPLIIILSAIFFVLRILGYIDWPWIWVFSPVWIGLAAAFVIMVVIMLGIVIKGKIDELKER